MVRDARVNRVKVHYCAGVAALATGYYSSITLPKTSDLATACLSVVPLVGPHGVYLHFLPPTRGMPRELPPPSHQLRQQSDC